MKTISVTIVGRKEFLTQFIECLKKVNKKDEYTLYASIEPTSNEIYDLVDSIDFINKKVIKNHKRLGVSENPYTLLSKVFDDGASHNIYLEEDLLFSQDITNLTDWVVSNVDHTQYSHFSTYNHSLKSKWAYENIHHVRERVGVFSPLGFAITKDQWNNHFEPNWHINKSGWDFSILEHISKNNLKNVEPLVSRTKHIGYYGTNCVFESKELHDESYDINYYDGPELDNYVMIQ